MRGIVPVGRAFGVRISLHVSWFLVLGLVVWATEGEFASLYPRMSAVEHVAMALATGLAFFACLLAHELAHSVVARKLGVSVLGITLFAFGGMARISGEIADAGDEFSVALIGPATSILLGCLFGSAGLALKGHLLAPAAVFSTLALVNLGVAAFNLVPGLPLDGGRMLRAGVWRISGNYALATKTAGVGGFILAGLLFLLGCYLIATREPLGVWYLLIGGFLAWMTRRATSGRPSEAAREGALASGHETQPPSSG